MGLKTPAASPLYLSSSSVHGVPVTGMSPERAVPTDVKGPRPVSGAQWWPGVTGP